MKLAPATFLLAVGIWLFQVITWLQTAVWTEFRLSDLLLLIAPRYFSETWLFNPRSWFGAHQIAKSMLGVPVALYLLGYSLWWLMVWAFREPDSLKR